MNKLYYGDNLDILREHIPSESVDLVYLDPPFNSNASYNVLFRSPEGRDSAAQISAFDDTWTWTESAEAAFWTVMHGDNTDAARVLESLRGFLGQNDMMAYLAMMGVRLLQLYRVLRPSGSLYLHCDPTASHYLKIILDAVFGLRNFRNEIVWRRSHPKGLAFTRFASNHDVILCYAKDASRTTWNPMYVPHDEASAAKQYAQVDEQGRRYQLTSLLNPNPDRPNLTYEFKGVTRVWRWTRERMEEADRNGLIVVPRNGEGIPRFKRYFDEQEGVPISDFWDDIGIVTGSERLGYPTQKPLALMERILSASSNAGDVVLDPFCGCGTTIHAAQKLGRRWIGIDVSHLSISLIERRVREAFGSTAVFETIGVPRDISAARDLAERDKHEFQKWAISLLPDARPYREGKKGADGGIDGILYLNTGRVRGSASRSERAIIEVKGGGVSVDQVHKLKSVIDREGALLGLFLTLREPTKQMVAEAAAAGFVETDHGVFPKVQIVTIESLLAGERPHLPIVDSSSFRKTRREDDAEQRSLF